MQPWPKRVYAITLFVDDLPATKAFYENVFGVPTAFEDDDSTVFEFGNILVNLLRTEAAPELVAPAEVAGIDAGVRQQLTIGVDDVDRVCQELVERGVQLLNGPIDRPWGVRTASFRDPAGHVWEIATTP
jgi:catechol 2,3-dioxygenase-like lactoylglutathione lyase family enzyme